MYHIMILWSAHCDMWPAQSSRFSIAVHVSSEFSKHISWHVFQNVSFLYIIILCQFWLVKLSRFQYYFDCDHTFDLFNHIEVYNCEAQLFLSQSISNSVCDLWNCIYHVMKSKILLLSLLHNVLEICYSSTYFHMSSTHF